jgi:alanyl-tRNA synthetase
VFEDLFGYHTLSVHFSADSSTLDLDTGSLAHDAIVKAERRANEVVVESRPVTTTLEDAATVAGLRKAPDRQGILRIISIRDLDRSACGGTHVSTTGEIGAILLRRVERIRKSTRIEFLCGGHAIARARADYEAMAEIATKLSASIEDVPMLVARQAEHMRESEQGRRRLERELATFRLRAMYDGAGVAANGIRFIELIGAPGGMDDLRLLAHAAIELPRAVFVASLADQPSVLVAASADSGLDACECLKGALAKVGGRGGGSPRIAQGTAPEERLLEVHRNLAEAAIANPVDSSAARSR